MGATSDDGRDDPPVELRIAHRPQLHRLTNPPKCTVSRLTKPTFCKKQSRHYAALLTTRAAMAAKKRRESLARSWTSAPQP